MTLEEDYLAQNHGNRLAAVLHVAAGLMRGNPDELKQGYGPAAALGTASRVFDLTEGERTELAEAAEFALGEAK